MGKLFLSVIKNASTYLALASGFLIIALLLVVVYEVWMRFVVNEPPGWAIEIPRLMFLVIIYLGLAYTTRMEGHVNLDVIITRLEKRKSGLLKVLTSFLAFCVSAVLLWQSVNILRDAFQQGWHTATVVPVIEWPFYVAMVIGCLAMCLEWVGKMVGGWRDYRNPAERRI